MNKHYSLSDYVIMVLAFYLSVSGLLDAFLFKSIGNVVYALISLFIILVLPAVLKRFHLHLGPLTLSLILCFAVLGTYLSNRYNLYKTFWWYDILLHFSSGVLIALTGNDLFFSRQKPSLLFRLFFCFIFALAGAAFWEILEFSLDLISGQDVQRNLLAEKEFLGKDWQNPGLKDTMNDIINGTAGGLLGTCLIAMSESHKEKLHEREKDSYINKQ